MAPLTRSAEAPWRHRTSLWPTSRVHGLIFLFKWDGKKDTREAEDVYGGHSDVFFASQVIQNACATQALISILLNLPADVEIGEMLRNFREFTAAFPPEVSRARPSLLLTA